MSSLDAERWKAMVVGATDIIRGASRITAICHENPDADTIGAAVGVALMARQLGKAAEVVSVDHLAPMFDYLDESRRVHRRPELAPDLAVVCDAASLERVGRIVDDEAEWFREARILNIDHHVTNTNFGQVNLVDPSASATCEVLFDMLEPLGVVADAGLASALLTGIVRDSHGFSDPSTSPRTMRVAAKLMEDGAYLPDIHRRILGELPFETLMLWGRILSTAASRQGGRIITAAVTAEMLEATQTRQHDADGVVEFLARSKGAEITILLRELGPNETRVSIRTAGEVNAATLAATYGGGGHARRAGCTIGMPLQRAVEHVLGSAHSALR